MPNPLVNVTQQSRRQDTSNQEPLTPIEEAYEGDNIPYRGTELHGVPWSQSDARTPPEYDKRAAVVHEAPPKVVDPVPVRVVDESGRELRQMRAIVAYAGGSGTGQARALVGRDENREFVKIKNANTAVVYIGHERWDHNGMLMNGYPLGDNETYETRSQEAVYASVDDPADAKVNLIVEYSTPLP